MENNKLYCICQKKIEEAINLGKVQGKIVQSLIDNDYSLISFLIDCYKYKKEIKLNDKAYLVMEIQMWCFDATIVSFIEKYIGE